MNYEPLQVGLPGQPACPDHYNQESTLIAPGSKRIYLQIGVNPAYVQFGTMPQGRGNDEGNVVWQPEEPYLPVIISQVRDYDAVRVRNYTAGEEAQAMLTPRTS